MAKATSEPVDFIKPLDMNGLAGRMLRLPAPTKKKAGEILFIYGQHSSLEQWQGLLSYLNGYAAVTAPDLPGFGGMESFHKIRKAPTIDNFADYLAAFMMLRYKRKKVAIVGASFGFVVATRMLQRYPELAERVKLIVSLDGFTHADDFSFGKRHQQLCRVVAWIGECWLTGRVIRFAGCHNRALRSYYCLLSAPADAERTSEDRERALAVDIALWRSNDVRTQAYTTNQLLGLDNCRQQLAVPVWHVASTAIQQLDPHRVEQHLLVAFHTVTVAANKPKTNATSLPITEGEAASLFPAKLRRLFTKL